ncbi:MAG: hypothetical protein U0840_29515 [Gemmataceae bacterium]
MARGHQVLGCRLRNPQGILLLIIALALVFASTLSAAAPPPPLPEEPAPGPLFNPEEVHVNPLHLSVGIVGASALPRIGLLASLGGLYGGEQHRAWNLEGPLTNRFARISLGTATLIGGGFVPLGGGPSLTHLANLKVGHQLDCWALMDTDQVRKLPNAWLGEVTDSQHIGAGGAEADVYSRVLILANFTSSKAFHRAARRDVTYTHVFNEPDRYRGTVVRVEGRLLRVNRYDPPFEAAQAGVNDFYEAWVFNEQVGANPYCLIFSEWPENLSRDVLGEAKIDGVIRVAMDGYFFKKYRYKANDRHGTKRDAPLVVGHGLIVLSQNAPGTNYSTVPVQMLITIFTVSVLGLIGGVIGLTYWYRRSDRRVRQRIMARMPEFHLPPPDVPPVAVPVAPPARPVELPAPITARINLPPGSGDRGGGSSGEGRSGNKDRGPPDEGAGA